MSPGADAARLARSVLSEHSNDHGDDHDDVRSHIPRRHDDGDVHDVHQHVLSVGILVVMKCRCS